MIKNDRSRYVKRADLGRGRNGRVARPKHQKSSEPERHFLNMARDLLSYVDWIHKPTAKAK